MTVSSLFEDISAFFRGLFSGEPLDIIWQGVFFLFGLVFVIILWLIVGYKLRMTTPKKIMLILSSTVYLWYFASERFPVTLEKATLTFDMIPSEGLIFKQLWVPFYQFSGIGMVFEIYYKQMIFFAVIGFIFALSVKRFKSPIAFGIFTVAALLFEPLFAVVNNLLHGGLSKTYDLAVLIIGIPLMFVGYGLARLLITLNGELYTKLHTPVTKRASESMKI